MKLAALFAQFLYQHKELKLPGLGVFTLDPNIPIPDAADKNFNEFTRNIQFSQQPVAHADESFINFIRTETGKIKPLAESDLDSYLSDGKILLNIGKPFHLEGIGYLLKNPQGGYVFTPGAPTLQKNSSGAAPQPHTDDSTQGPSIFERSSTSNSRKIGAAAAIIAGIVIVVWLGYTLYNRNPNNSPISTSESVTATPHGTAAGNPLLDSAQNKIDSVGGSIVSTNYKFIIERTANRNRAYRRLNQIKETLTDIRMESPDSTIFTLYFVLPAQPSDTARIRDSLKTWYARKRVYVEPISAVANR